jgi:hypothetical protein
MPKEYVDGPSFADGVPFRVLVRWGRDMEDVQIATVNENEPAGSLSAGLWVDLNRSAINRLIQHLRRARDQAFGRDE